MEYLTPKETITTLDTDYSMLEVLCNHTYLEKQYNVVINGETCFVGFKKHQVQELKGLYFSALVGFRSEQMMMEEVDKWHERVKKNKYN